MSLPARSVEHTGESNLGLHLAERVQPGSFDAHLSCEWYGRYVELGSASVGLNA
jgi:hypothetical protein